MEKIYTHVSKDIYYFEEVIKYLESYEGTDLKVLSYHIDYVYDPGRPYSFTVTVTFCAANRFDDYA